MKNWTGWKRESLKLSRQTVSTVVTQTRLGLTVPSKSVCLWENRTGGDSFADIKLNIN